MPERNTPVKTPPLYSNPVLVRAQEFYNHPPATFAGNLRGGLLATWAGPSVEWTPPLTLPGLITGWAVSDDQPGDGAVSTPSTRLYLEFSDYRPTSHCFGYLLVCAVAGAEVSRTLLPLGPSGLEELADSNANQDLTAYALLWFGKEGPDADGRGQLLRARMQGLTDGTLRLGLFAVANRYGGSGNAIDRFASVPANSTVQVYEAVAEGPQGPPGDAHAPIVADDATITGAGTAANRLRLTAAYKGKIDGIAENATANPDAVELDVSHLDGADNGSFPVYIDGNAEFSNGVIDATAGGGLAVTFDAVNADWQVGLAPAEKALIASQHNDGISVYDGNITVAASTPGQYGNNPSVYGYGSDPAGTDATFGSVNPPSFTVGDDTITIIGAFQESDAFDLRVSGNPDMSAFRLTVNGHQAQFTTAQHFDTTDTGETWSLYTFRDLTGAIGAGNVGDDLQLKILRPLDDTAFLPGGGTSDQVLAGGKPRQWIANRFPQTLYNGPLTGYNLNTGGRTASDDGQFPAATQNRVSPAIDVADFTDRTLLLDVEWTLNTRSVSTVAFNQVSAQEAAQAQLTIRSTHQVAIRRVSAADSYSATNNHHGVLAGESPIVHSGAAELGVGQIYLVKTSGGNLALIPMYRAITQAGQQYWAFAIDVTGVML